MKRIAIRFERIKNPDHMIAYSSYIYRAIEVTNTMQVNPGDCFSEEDIEKYLKDPDIDVTFVQDPSVGHRSGVKP